GYARHRVEQWEATARQWLGPVGGWIAGNLATHLPLSIKGARALRHLALSPADACARKHAYGLFEAPRDFYSYDFARAVRSADRRLAPRSPRADGRRASRRRPTEKPRRVRRWCRPDHVARAPRRRSRSPASPVEPGHAGAVVPAVRRLGSTGRDRRRGVN